MKIKVSEKRKVGDLVVTVTVEMDNGFPPLEQGKHAKAILRSMLLTMNR